MMFDELANSFFETKDEYERALRLLREYRVAYKQSRTFSDLEENFLINLDDCDDQLLDSALALLRERDQRPKGNGHERIGITREELEQLIDAQHSRSTSRSGVLHSKLISDAFEESLAEKRHGWKSTNGSEGQYRDQILPLFMELHGDLDTASVNKHHTAEFTTAVLALPKNRRKMPEYRDLSIRELMKLSIPDEKKLSTTTKKNYLQRLTDFLRWMENRDYSERNLYAPLKVGSLRKVKRAHEERAQYTDIELSKLFNSDDYTQGLHTHSFQYWVPLIGLFSGARANEICQIFTDDVRQDEETRTWVIDFNENDPDRTRKSLKRPSHGRIFPIHRQLIALGILEFADYRRQRGEERLFPELPYRNKNKYADKLQRWYNVTYEKQCGLSGRTSFHSLRHTTINYFKRQLKLDTNAFVHYIGQSESGTESDRRYIKPLELDKFNDVYRMLKFKCIDFSRIRPWKAQAFYRRQTRTR